MDFPIKFSYIREIFWSKWYNLKSLDYFNTIETHYKTIISIETEKIILFLLLVLPLLCIIFCFFYAELNYNSRYCLYEYALYFSAFSFLLSLYFLFSLNKRICGFQAILNIQLSPLFLDSWFSFGVDFISVSLIILTNLFIYLCILSIRFIEIKTKLEPSEYINKLFFIQWGLIGAFSSLDLVNFFIFFEATLIPIFFIILQGGSRERKTRASYLIALYTLFGSVFMLFNIIYLLNKYGTTNYIYLSAINISLEDQKFLWITFFLAFAAKIPVFPFHIWLPEAHVEAPTIGSVLLAALLLKLGVYGLIRFGLPLFPYGQEYFKHIIVVLTICSFFYTNLTAIRQVDIKKIIAYSSVVHMNLIVLGILCISVESLDGAVYQMLAHGIVSGALFFCIGIIYERFKSRFLWYYGGIAFILPLYSIFLFIFILANISFPTTSNFIGEMLLFFGIFKDNFTIGIFAALSMFWGVIYNIWTYNRICFGNIKVAYDFKAKHDNSLYNVPEMVNVQYNLDKISKINLYKIENYTLYDKKIVHAFLINPGEFYKDMSKKEIDKEWEKFQKTRFYKIVNFFWEIGASLKIITHFPTQIIYLYFGFKTNAWKLYNNNLKHLDIDYKDFYILLLLTFLLLLTGIYSPVILDYITINNSVIVDHAIQILRTSFNLNKDLTS